MRALHFYKTSFPDTMGGVEQVINQIAEGAVKLGVETDVLSLTSERASTTIEINGYRVHRAKLDAQIASTGFSASAFGRFARLARSADVIHYHFPWPFMDVVHFATNVRKPTVVTYHSDIVRQKYLLKLYRPLRRKFLNDVSCIVATSPNYVESSNVLAEYREKVSVIPIGLDKSSYPTPTAELMKQWREKLGSRFFLFVGVLRYYKGLHVLIDAVRGSDYPVAIVGSGPVESQLKAQVTKLGLRNVHFLGHLDEANKIALFTLCYAVVLPSHLRSEAFGVSLLEGAMYGKPMISSEIGTGTSFINVAGETGLVVPPADSYALRQAMDFLWNHPADADRMGRQAEDRYWKLFTAARMADEYVTLYRRLVTR